MMRRGKILKIPRPASWVSLFLAIFCLSACGFKIVGGDPLTSSSTSVSLAVGNSYPLSISGGTPPYSYSIASGSGSVSSSTGLYTAPASPGPAVVRVTDSTRQTIDVTFTINPALSLNTSSIAMPTKSQYTYPFSTTGGVPPYNYSLASGPGTVGSLSGVYTASTSSGTTQLRVTDSLGNSTQAAIQNIPVRTNGSVMAAITNGTSLYIGGSFTTINPYPAPKMIALDTNTGNPVLSFDLQAGFNGNIKAFVFHGNSIYVGGQFTTYRGVRANRLAKLDLATGNLDSAFTQATGFNFDVNALAISGDSLYAGGWFNAYRGIPAGSLAKLDLTTGNLDTTFTQATGFDRRVNSLAISGNSLYAGGMFTTYRGTAASRLAKLDLTTGNLDSTFTQATGFNTIVSALAASSSALYVGGAFATYRGAAANFLAKLDLTTGNLDSSFTQATGFDSTVNTLAISGSSLYAGGSFTTYRGTAANDLAKLDLTTGNLDSTFTQATGFDGGIAALTISGNSLYVAGAFTNYRGNAARALAKLDLVTGNLYSTFTQATGFDTIASALAISGNTLYVGGWFNFYGGTPANHLAKLDAMTGTLDSTFTQTNGFDNTVSALAISGSSLYAGGSFTQYRGAAANDLAKLDLATGNLDSAFTQATGFNGGVSALAISGSSLYAGGAFSTYRGVPAKFLAKLDLATGTLDTAFTQATGCGNNVDALAISGSSLYVGGAFFTYRGVPAKSLAKLDLTTGNLDATFTQATGFDSGISALAISGGSLYAGGSFTTYRATPANRLAKLDLATGNLDTAFTQATGFDGPVIALAISGSSLYAGGSGFATYRGAAAQNLAKLDLATGNLDTTFTQATGINGLVSTLAISGSSLYAGGFFSSYRGQAAYCLIPVDLISGTLAE